MRSAEKSVTGKVALAASAALLAVALPSSVFAIGALHDAGENFAVSRFGFTPAAADPDIAKLVAQRTGAEAQLMRFTPAGAAAAPQERSVTVAVRVDQATAQALSASPVFAAAVGSERSATGLSVAPVRYNLGLARGYGSFAQSPAQAAAPARIAPSESVSLSSALSNAKIPDLATFAPRERAQGDSRFAARVELDEQRSVASREDGRASVSDQMLDVGGSYRLTRNLDITAGVRYEQDRDIVPLPDIEQQDSQAVYIGTQFRF